MKISTCLIAIVMLAVVSVDTYSEDSKSCDCTKYIRTISDKMEGTQFQTSMKTWMLTQDSISGIILNMNYSRQYNTMTASFVVACQKSNCIDKNGYAIFMFTDSSKVSLSNNYGFNCDGKYSVNFGDLGRDNQIQDFVSKDLLVIRIYTAKSFVEEPVSIKDAVEIKNTFKCMQSFLK